MNLFRSIKRRWGRWLIALLAAAVVVVVGGPFVFFHFIEGPAPAPFHLSKASQPASGGSGSSGSSSGSTASVEGVWKVTSGSQAGYRVQEILFGQSHTAVGRTSAVTGSLTIDGTTVTTASFSVDLTKVKSDEALRDDQFQTRIMDTAQYPTATFRLARPIDFGSVPAAGVELTETATGTLDLHGATRTVTFKLGAERSGADLQVTGSIPITFADWNIANPSGGPAQTGNSGTMEFLIDLAR